MNLNKFKKALRLKMKDSSLPLKIAALATLSLPCALHAQTGFDLGLKGIIQTTSLLNSNDIAAGEELNYKNKTTGGVGVSGGYSFTKHLGAEIDILYSKQGQGYVGEVSQINGNSRDILSSEFQSLAAANNIPFTGNYTARVILNCIKIPILFRFTGNNSKKVFFSSFIGPQINMLSSASIQINGATASLSSYGTSTSDLYKKTTLDGVLGLGAGCNISDNLVLSLHLRLDYGFGDAENKSATVNAAGGRTDVYGSGRAVTNNATGGGLIGLSYRLIKKAKAPAKKPTPSKGK